MSNLFLYLVIGGILYTGFSQGLEKSTQIHCNTGIQAACEELIR
jgi:hypothetical protein|tara:strand:+ start:680 stop:811 length:132 start_codon:yes stop_codon:yes gene_type:complete